MDLALLRDRGLELVVELLDLFDDLGRLGQLRREGERSGLGLLSCAGVAVSGSSQLPLIDRSQEGDALADRVDRGEIPRPEDEMGASSVRVEARP